MRRREFVTLVGGAAVVWPRTAQQPAVPVIGFLGSRLPDSDAHLRGRVSSAPERSRLRRGPKRGHLISLGGKSIRATAGVGGQSG
jgi:hypothetical protein